MSMMRGLPLTRRELLTLLTASTGIAAFPAWAAQSKRIAPQPFFASAMRAVDALANAGQPMSKADVDALAALAAKSDEAAVTAAEEILDRYTLLRVAFASAGADAGWGGATRELIEQGWRSFLVRFDNERGIVGTLQPLDRAMTKNSFNAQRVSLGDTLNKAPAIEQAWLRSQFANKQPLLGAPVEYLVIDVFSRDRGQRRSELYFQSEAAGGFKTPPADFVCLPSQDIALSILDSDGIGCMASLTIKDARQRVYPPQTSRLAPDLIFQPQIYRADGENVRLPEGEYEVTSWRGPEYVRQVQRVSISERNRRIAVRLERWIDPIQWGWYSGDTHIHSAGCSHYGVPTEGVSPETMIRHVRGEALVIGSSLNWGPGWYYQKQFFSGHTISPEAGLEHPHLQEANNAALKPKPTPKDKQSLLRYDVEVSGFPSGRSGHVILLQLKEQDYPGAATVEEWPSYTLPVMKWAKAQGGLVGFAHCSAGMQTSSNVLPNFEIPSFSSIGTNEAIVDIIHDACDFLSGCDGQPVAELNAWYHMLNCGLRLSMVGETDFPCIYDERVGMGRSYVQLDRHPVDDQGYAEWLQGVKSGKLYCGDGFSHFLEFSINRHKLGGEDVKLRKPGHVAVRALIAARLEVEPQNTTTVSKTPLWHIEHARIKGTRKVPVELVVNGQPVERVEFIADGKPRPLTFRTRIERSSWVALRIMPSGHTHPIFVSVDDKPIRASRRSAEWLRQCVDALWTEKHRLIRDSERAAAAEAYDHARRAYDRIIAESDLA